jgi:predicted phage gp36 major capsid-like protein
MQAACRRPNLSSPSEGCDLAREPARVTKDDARVTTLDRCPQRSSLGESPQFLQVLAGILPWLDRLRWTDWVSRQKCRAVGPTSAVTAIAGAHPTVTRNEARTNRRAAEMSPMRTESRQTH